MEALLNFVRFSNWLAENRNSDIEKMSVTHSLISPYLRSLQSRKWLLYTSQNTWVGLFSDASKPYEYLCLCSMSDVSQDTNLIPILDSQQRLFAEFC